MIEIRSKCHSVDEVRTLIAEFWGPRHALLHDARLLDWQHKDADGSYNFFVAEDENVGCCGLLGYIPISQWDASVRSDAWFGAIWAANPDAPGAGLLLLKRLIEVQPEHRYYTVGMSDIAARIYARLGIGLETLGHYFLPAGHFNPSQWGGLGKTFCAPLSFIHRFDIRLVGSDDLESAWEAEWTERYPTRSEPFVRKRFLEHPTYEYQLHIATSEHARVFIASRIVESHIGKCLKILDVLSTGDPAPLLPSAVSALVEDSGASFADYYCIDRCTATSTSTLGLLRVSDFPGVVVPNYFSPFEPRNVTLRAAHTFPLEFVTRSDGDQDRPS